MTSDSDLSAVSESIASVLALECPSAAVHAFIDGHNSLDRQLWKQAGELGWLAMAPAEQHGGLGLGAAGLARLHFELGRVCAPGAFLATSVALEVLSRADAADKAPLAGLLAKALAGAGTLAIAANPAAAGDAATWLLGEPDAAAALVAGEGDDLLVVDMRSGVPERITLWDETRSMVSFRGRPEAISVLPHARPVLEAVLAVGLAADSAGLARGILDRTVAYMKEREQFGRPIGSFQALKHRVADHLIRVIVAEQHVAQAAEHVDGPGRALWPAMAKANATDAAVAVAGDCVQLHGGVGFTREYDPHLYAKRARLNEMLLAPNSVLRDRAEQALCASVRDNIDLLEIAR